MTPSADPDDISGRNPAPPSSERPPPAGGISEGEAMREAAFAISTVAGEGVFRALVTSLARILGTDLAFIALPIPGTPARLRMLAFHLDGRMVEDFVYPIAGTPCETVIGQQYRVYPADLTRLFPKDDDFARLGLSAYAGFPLTDAHGGPLGLISVVSRRPLPDAALVEAMLKIFAARAVTEIERARADAQRAQLEAQLRQAQKMEAIGQLTGGIAHDFNNILTSVLGYTVLALERAEAAGDHTLVRYLEQTQRASQRARDLIQQMLTFSRGRRGEPRPLMLGPQVRESLALLRSTLPTTIDLDTDLAGDVSHVLADPVQCEQVLLNLCINARDAMAGAGTIRVAVRRTTYTGSICASCRKTVRGDYIELAVTDTGPGIEPAVLDRMFEPFFTTKEVGKGSGMGLATVHGIAHEHRGHVIVESAPGKGSTFRVLFPAPRAEDGLAPATADGGSRPNPGGRRLAGRVLVVDDEPMIADYMRELLAGWGLDVTLRQDALDAERWYAEDPQRVDLVITDQTMPRRTGLELARRMALQRPELPILLHTGYGEDLPADVLSRSGVCALLRKPVDPGQLLRLLEQHLPRQGT